MLTVGDRSQAFQSLNTGARLKTDLNRYSNELSSGKPADVAKHLSGRTAAVAGLDRDIERIDGFLDRATALDLTLDRQQLALASITETLEDSGLRMIVVRSDTTLSQLETAEKLGEDAFGSAIERLNGFSAGRSLFSGVATDRVPLASAQTILDALEIEVAGLTEAGDIATAVRDWFADPVGGFSAVAYQGATGDAAKHRISEIHSIDGTARADAPEVRSALAASATAALSARLSGTIGHAERADLLKGAGTDAFSAAQGLHGLAARIGDDQALIANERVRLGAQRTMFASARNDRVNLDPFESASRLQEAQQSLELHFTATARLSRLSLANYL
ncbi:hypothetical protein EU805_00415 [Salipiger sp. IMCC34102]|uniref:hypothetical protein n=1 Tax=Salipiger sp. IMCC34102 TaxID=2510647 RepID=UPI00101C63A9|nr:hypothetical protein [Salipiger sp. IMCC34102]RYH03870.1 hypothetical protein EU805_00415 [Salipiger sp. IMCC34102]